MPTIWSRRTHGGSSIDEISFSHRDGLCRYRRPVRSVLVMMMLVGCVVADPSYLGPISASGEGTGTTTHPVETTGTSAVGTAEGTGSGSASGTSNSADATSASADATSSDGTTTGSMGETGNGPGHVIFVSSTVHDGVLMDLAEADQHCQSLAEAAMLSGTWKALLSTTREPAFERLAIAGEVRNVMGDLVAADADEFWSANHPAPILYDQSGVMVTDFVWTGTNRNGEPANFNCDDWTDLGTNGMNGRPQATNSSWVEHMGASCGELLRYYCVSD